MEDSGRICESCGDRLPAGMPCPKCSVVIHVQPAELRLEGQRLGTAIRSPLRRRAPGSQRRHGYEEIHTPGYFHGDPDRPVDQLQIIDRDNDRKVHRVTDESTGEILVDKEEKLSDAVGRGTAKPRD